VQLRDDEYDVDEADENDIDDEQDNEFDELDKEETLRHKLSKNNYKTKNFKNSTFSF
jgi:hypothetical protein